MFHELSLMELKSLVKDLREHHNIRGYSRMKKESLVAELTARFILRDGHLYLKEELAARTYVPPPTKARSNKALEHNIYNFLSSLSYAALNNTSPSALINEFQSIAGINMARHEVMFKKLIDEVLIHRKR